MSPEEALALGKSILKEAFYETPTENEDDLLTKAFQLRQIASDKGASEF